MLEHAKGKVRSISRNAAAFAAALICTAWMLRQLPQRSELDQFLEKQNYFSQHRNDYDTLFLGSSRINRQIDPAVFDTAMAGSGTPTKSFNFGIDGMFAFEDSFCCKQVLGLCRPGQLRFVFVEESRFFPESAKHHFNSRRLVTWHDLEHTYMALRELYDRSLPKVKRRKFLPRLMAAWPALSIHLDAFLRRSTSLGEGTLSLRSFLNGAARPAYDQALSTGAGFHPFPQDPEPLKEKLLGGYDFDLARCSSSQQTFAPLSPVEQENLDEIVRLIRDTGATPVLIVSPTPVSTVYRPRSEPGALVLDFSDFRKFPVLYLRENRRDTDHLNRAGAEIYSRLLAESCLAGERNIQK